MPGGYFILPLPTNVAKTVAGTRVKYQYVVPDTIGINFIIRNNATYC